MVDLPVAVRLRRAILRNDALLVNRIIKNNPKFLRNPDFSDKSNTSLHLAAALGYLDVIKVLVAFGHDSSTPNELHSGYDSSPGISVNADSSTPLHLAAAHNHAACVDFLCHHFPATINRRDKKGATPLMLAAQGSSFAMSFSRSTALVPPSQRPRSSSNPPEDTSTVMTLLAHKASVIMEDAVGNTVLHYASAWGNLKVFRLLVSAGASPLALNDAGYPPADYASTMQASAYCETLATEYERLKAEESQQQQQQFSRQHQQAQQQSLQQRRQLQQQESPFRLKVVTEAEANEASMRSSPVSPMDGRTRRDLGKVGLGLSRVGNPPPSAMRLVIHDDHDGSEDDVPLTARKISSDGMLAGSYDWNS